MKIPPHKSKPQRVRRWERDKENRDCPQYDECLTNAALRNLACVPCKGCPKNLKSTTSQEKPSLQPTPLLPPPRIIPETPIAAPTAPLNADPGHSIESISKPISSPKPKPIPKPKPSPKSLFRDLLPRGMYPKDGRVKQAEKLIVQGKGNREIHQITGMHTVTVTKLRKILETKRGKPFLCPCGKLATHQGWCPIRIQRRIWLASWGRKK